MAVIEHPRSSDIARYLDGARWTRVSERPDVWRPAEDSDLRIVLWLRDEQPGADAQEALEALRVISYHEQRPLSDVTNDVLLYGADTLAFRFTPDTPQGQAPLPLAAEALNHIRSLIVASASALSVRRAVLPTRRPAAAEKLADSARVAFEKGSFVVNVTLPLQDHPADQGALAEPAVTATRQVTRRVISSLRAAQDLAAQVNANGRIEAFAQGDAPVVNATELEAFASIGGPNQSPYSVRFSTSPLDTDSGAATGRVEVSRAEQLVFKEGAEYLRKQVPRDGVTVRGLAVKLERRRKSGGPGTITIEPSSDDLGVRSVKVELVEEDYNDAIRAHHNGLVVVMIGDLVFTGRFWRLVSVSGFTVEQPRDERPHD